MGRFTPWWRREEGARYSIYGRIVYVAQQRFRVRVIVVFLAHKLFTTSRFPVELLPTRVALHSRAFALESWLGPARQQQPTRTCPSAVAYEGRQCQQWSAPCACGIHRGRVFSRVMHKRDLPVTLQRR
jgi:hypothetical protein